MKKLNRVQKSSRKSWLIVGMVLSLAVIGVSGCGAKATTTPTATSETQSVAPSSSSSNADASATQKSTTSSQETQGQTTQRPGLNPAIEAAMSIHHLQENQQMALTSDQKDKIKPILQLLMDTTDPSQEFLQQKADAINAVFTERQQTFLSTNTQKGNPNGKSPDGTAQPKDQPNGQKGDTKDNQSAPSSQPQDIYKQVLASLT